MNEQYPYTFLIVVVAKDEELNVPFITGLLLQEYPADKIIFVLDGDLEPTTSILASKRIKFIQGNNTGKGSAIKIAIERIPSDILVFMDADGSHSPHEIEGLLGPLMNNESEMVIGSRFLGNSEELSGSIGNFMRYIGNLVTNHIINLLWNRNKPAISDTLNGFKAIKRSFFSDIDLTEKGFAIEVELVIKCLKKGYRIREIPSFELKRKYGQSHISVAHLTCFIKCFIKNMI